MTQKIQRHQFKFRYIEALRGWAILGVVLVHTSQYGDKTIFFPSALKAVVENGARGVQLFFVTSALTLYISMNNRHDKERNSKLNFFIRRFFRIAPLFYLGIIWYGFVSPQYKDDIFTSIEFILNIFFINWFNPYYITHLVPGGWSIAIEFAFYALLPFLFSKVYNLNSAVKLLLWTIALNTLCTSILRHIHIIPDGLLWENFLFYYFPNQLPIFVLGIILFFLIKMNITTINHKILFVSAIFLLANFSTKIYTPETGFPYLPKHLFFGFGFLLLAWSLSMYEPVFVVNRIICLIGRFSFSIYLSHFAILYYITKFGLVNLVNSVGLISAFVNFGIRYFIVLIISCGLAWILYNLIELPGQQIGYRLINKLENR